MEALAEKAVVRLDQEARDQAVVKIAYVLEKIALEEHPVSHATDQEGKN